MRGAADRQRGDLMPVLLLAIVLPLVLGTSPRIFADGDIGWHIATGQWILDHRVVPTSDPFGGVPGQPWLPIEWGSELLYAISYRAGGWAGVAVLVGAALTALFAILIGEVRRWGHRQQMIATMIVAVPVLIPFIFARPHVLAWPLLAGWTVLLMRARERGDSPHPAWALLMLLWANLHGSFAIGLAIAGWFGVEALVRQGWSARVAGRWLGFGLAALAAAAATPFGIAGLLHPLTIATMAALPLIVEWLPSSPLVTPWFFVALAAMAAAMLWRRRPMDPLRALLIAGLTALALLQTRHQAVLAIVATLLLAKPLAGAGERPSASPLGRREILIGLCSAALVLALRLPFAQHPADSEFRPIAAIAALPSRLRVQPGLNSYSAGGPLLLAGIVPYIDGRADLYGDDYVERFQRLRSGDHGELARAVAERHVAWALVNRTDAAFLTMMAREPGWRRIYADEAAVVFERMP